MDITLSVVSKQHFFSELDEIRYLVRKVLFHYTVYVRETAGVGYMLPTNTVTLRNITPFLSS